MAARRLRPGDDIARLAIWPAALGGFGLVIGLPRLARARGKYFDL
jgi:hypothetical protein